MALEELLQRPKSRAALRRTPDHRFLAEMTRAIFQAGFVWRVVEHKWDGFETAFKGFEPAPIARLSEKKLEALASDERIIRNPQKIRAVRENAGWLVVLAKEHGTAARFFADWPPADFVGLWDQMKRFGCRLGGMTGPMFLRRLGIDTPMLTNDVVAALREQGVLEQKSPTSARALRAIHQAFESWREESGRSNTEISRILSCSTGDVYDPHEN